MRARLVVGAVAVSLAGLGLIQSHEGRSLPAYPDPAHGVTIPTICYGHTRGVRMGDVATPKQCDLWLEEDAHVAVSGVLRHVTAPLSQGELDAYTSFVYNAGAGNFAKSTALKRLNAGDPWGACMALLPWVNSNGRPLRGLIDRRYAEYNVCINSLPFERSRR